MAGGLFGLRLIAKVASVVRISIPYCVFKSQ